MPATNASSEKSFSALKTYFRATMTNKHLDNLIVLHVHKQKTDNMDLTVVGNGFDWKDSRHQEFGKFIKNYISQKNKSTNKSSHANSMKVIWGTCYIYISYVQVIVLYHYRLRKPTFSEAIN